MIALLTASLFFIAAILATGAIAVSWQHYGSAALALRQQLRDCDVTQELRYTVTTLEVRRESAKIYRPDFKRKLRSQAPLRAAA